MKATKFAFLMSLFTLCLAGCGGTNTPSSSNEPEPVSSEEPPAPPVVDNRVNVFLLSGQSNMEGSTYYKDGDHEWLKDYLDSVGLDIDPILDGIEEVQTSYYGFYYPNDMSQAHASNEEDKLAGKFLPTTVGMGVGDHPGLMMGPEVGMANTLKDYTTTDNPIFFIKCAFSGSGFQNGNPNWGSRDDDYKKSLYKFLVEFTHNNLQLIEDEGYEPVLRGFVWHQGESDGSTPNYDDKMLQLITDVREEFADYALDGDGDNIAFIDAYIFDGDAGGFGYGDGANNMKDKLHEKCTNSYLLNTSTKKPDGMDLRISGYLPQDVPAMKDYQGAMDIYHYTTESCYRLGEGFANIIIDEGLLDF